MDGVLVGVGGGEIVNVDVSETVSVTEGVGGGLCVSELENVRLLVLLGVSCVTVAVGGSERVIVADVVSDSLWVMVPDIDNV